MRRGHSEFMQCSHLPYLIRPSRHSIRWIKEGNITYALQKGKLRLNKGMYDMYRTVLNILISCNTVLPLESRVKGLK